MRLPSRWECAVQEKERDGKESMGDAPSATGIAQISVQSPGQRLLTSIASLFMMQISLYGTSLVVEALRQRGRGQGPISHSGCCQPFALCVEMRQHIFLGAERHTHWHRTAFITLAILLPYPATVRHPPHIAEHDGNSVLCITHPSLVRGQLVSVSDTEYEARRRGRGGGEGKEGCRDAWRGLYFRDHWVLNPRKGEVTNLQDVPTMAHPLSAGAAAPHSVRIRRRHRGKPSLISPSSRTVADIAIHDGNDAKIETRRANRRGARKRDASASFQHIRAPIARKNGLKGVGGEGITKPSKTPPQGPPTRRFSAPLGCLSGALCLGWREADAYLAESESGRCARHTNTKGSHRLSGDFQDLTRTPADDILSHQASTHIIARQNLEASSPTEQAERRRCAKRRRLAQRLGPSRTKTQILQRLDNAYPNLPQDTAPSEPRRDSARVSKIATSNTEFAARTCARAQGFFGTLHKAQRPTHIAGSDQRWQRKRPFDEAAAVTSVRHFVRGVVELAEQQVPPPKPLHFSCRGRGTRKREAEPRARLDVFGRITLVKILTKRRVLASFLSLASPVSS
ncbi:hypothetical protein EV121DRAFT_273932 [Schizophyllum commune]